MLLDNQKPCEGFFRIVRDQFSWKQRPNNYKDLIGNTFSCQRKMECNISLKIHFLYSHLDWFPYKCFLLRYDNRQLFLHDMCWGTTPWKMEFTGVSRLLLRVEHNKSWRFKQKEREEGSYIQMMSTFQSYSSLSVFCSFYNTVFNDYSINSKGQKIVCINSA